MLHEIKEDKFLATVEGTGQVLQIVVHNAQGHGNIVLNLPRNVAAQLAKAVSDSI